LTGIDAYEGLVDFFAVQLFGKIPALTFPSLQKAAGARVVEKFVLSAMVRELEGDVLIRNCPSLSPKRHCACPSLISED